MSWDDTARSETRLGDVTTQVDEDGLPASLCALSDRTAVVSPDRGHAPLHTQQRSRRDRRSAPCQSISPARELTEQCVVTDMSGLVAPADLRAHRMGRQLGQVAERVVLDQRLDRESL